MIDFLFISNGFGEDAIGAKIARLVSEACGAAAFPLVGQGAAYRERGIEVLSGFPHPPGEGIALWKDLHAGLPQILRRQWKSLKELRGEVRFAVAVGDILPCVFSRFCLKREFCFVGTAKSVDVAAYNFLEAKLLAQAALCFVRDEKTAQALRKRAPGARWVGNPMMDEVEEHAAGLPPFNGTTVAVFPGSRRDAPRNFRIQAQALSALARNLNEPVRGVVRVSPAHRAEDFLSGMESWDGIFHPHAGSPVLGEMKQEGISFLLTRAGIGDVLRASRLVFGQAGTANEQAAGAGLPVLAFDLDFYRNGRLSWYRRRQKKLLGKALEVTAPNAETLAARAAAILKDSGIYGEMSKDGKERMGPPGGSRKIAAALQSLKKGDRSVYENGPVPFLARNSQSETT